MQESNPDGPAMILLETNAQYGYYLSVEVVKDKHTVVSTTSFLEYGSMSISLFYLKKFVLTTK